MRAAVEALQQQSAARIVVAVPVGARDTCAELKTVADDAICARSPDPFFAVGQWYADFSQTSDDEVRDLLAQAATPESLAREPKEHQAISIGARKSHGYRRENTDWRQRGSRRLAGSRNAAGVVLFAHGSGSSRHSPRTVLSRAVSRKTASRRC